MPTLLRQAYHVEGKLIGLKRQVQPLGRAHPTPRGDLSLVERAESPAQSLYSVIKSAAVLQSAFSSLSQVRLAHALVLQQFLGRAGENHPARLQDVSPMGDLEGCAGVLLHQQDRHPTRVDLTDGV